MKFSTLQKWLCDCFCRGPRPRVDMDNECTAVGGGINPMNGEACTEPSLVPGDTLIDLAEDPPQCHGGTATLCQPMPASFRVTFPCPVPGTADCP